MSYRERRDYSPSSRYRSDHIHEERSFRSKRDRSRSRDRSLERNQYNRRENERYARENDYRRERSRYDSRDRSRERQRDRYVDRNRSYSSRENRNERRDSQDRYQNDKNDLGDFDSSYVQSETVEPKEKEEIQTEQKETAAEEDDEMMKLLGFSNFDSTKGKHLKDKDVGIADVKKKRNYRRFFNTGYQRPAAAPE